MGNPIKYKIGSLIGDWKIIDIIEGQHLKYKIQCKCYFERIVPSNKLSSLTLCADCKKKQKSAHMIGEKIGNFEIISTPAITGNRKYFIKCRCGNEYFTTLYQMKTSESCKGCKRGFYKGKIVKGCTFLERIKGIKWKIQCHCGNIYEGRSTSRFTDCGCSKSDKYFQEAKNKIGFKFGKLKIIDVLKVDRHNILVCKCKCGNTIQFINGHECKRNSCGCLKQENVPRSEKKGNAKLKNFEVLSIREFIKEKTYTFDQISIMYEINKHYLFRIITGDIWKHLLGAIPDFKRGRPKIGKYKPKVK